MQINGQNNKIEFHTNIVLHEDENLREIKDWKEMLGAIIKQLPEKIDTLQPIIQFLVMAIAPTKIYLLDHGNTISGSAPSYIDLLLVISNKNNIPFAELEPIIEIPYIKDSRVVCSLHNEGVVLEALKNGHIFYTMNFIRKNLVYDDKCISYPVTTMDAIQEIKQRAKTAFLQHFDRAEDFYAAAEFLHQKGAGKIIAFLLHQAVEFSYRSILASLNGYDKRTHELHSLKKHTRRCAPQLATIFSSEAEEEKRLTELLNNAYLDSRYDTNYSVTENDLMIIFEKVKLLQDICKELVETKTNPAT
jgi:HEPN domain-containing protein